jgi:hypothetical protein
MLDRPLSRLLAPSLLTLLLFGCQAALAQEAPLPAAPEARRQASDFNHLLKPSAEPEAAEAAEAGDAAETETSAGRAAREEFGRTAGRAAELFPADGQDAGAQAPQTQPTPQPYVPLTQEQKMRRAFKSAFLSPQGYALAAFRATLTQAGEDELPDKEFEDEFGDWAARFARNVANRAARNIFASGVYPVLFKQDPRYERATKKGFMNRTAHAVSRVFVTRGDDGDIEPNVSRAAGVLTANALSNIWERSTPGHDRRGVDATFRRFAMSFPSDMAYNVLREFLPDIIGIFRK